LSDTGESVIDWQIEGSRVVLRMRGGTIVRPTASEVAGAEFKGRLTIRGEPIPRKPSDAIPGVSFSRYPLEATLEVSPPSADLAIPPSCRIRLGDTDVEVSPDEDQLIHGDVWYPLPVAVLSEIQGLIKAQGIAGPMTLKQYLDLRWLDTGLLTFVPEPSGNRRVTASVELPRALNATLYPYQVDGFQWLSRISDEGLGCILGDEMGLGKTLQVIALLLRDSERKVPSLVVAPATLLENWRRELARFAPTLNVSIHRGHGRTGYPRELRTFDVVVTSYDTAMRDISILEMVPWNVVVLDEAQAIKTPDAARTVTIKTIPRRVGVAVTGTPVENRLRDLWSLMDFAAPAFLGRQNEFEARYSDDIGGASALEPLVTPLILRRRVADVAKDLPERIDIPQPIEISDESAARYDKIRDEIAAQYGAAATIVSLTKLRMYCTHPFLVDGGDGDPLPGSTKYSRLLEILDEVIASGEKALIFTSFTGMADILVSDLPRRYGIPVRVIDGRTPVDKRQPIVDEFAAATTSAILVLNPKAAGTGLNITAANHVIHYNLEWNPAVEDQATARAFRRGQTRPVTVHRLFHPGTVEEVIAERTQRKRQVAGTAIIGTAGGADDLADVVAALKMSPAMSGIP
jgi:SNF2 family DNA or RNA helicase